MLAATGVFQILYTIGQCENGAKIRMCCLGRGIKVNQFLYSAWVKNMYAYIDVSKHLVFSLILFYLTLQFLLIK